jgi:two-component system, chemotaxis family, sensor kinase CheA
MLMGTVVFVDSTFLIYLEETEDMLQKAEELLIQLETDYSQTSINELFRIAHTIKGSSNVVGFEDIGNLMHRVEDMLDCARSGSIKFEQKIVSLCFEGVDIVTKILQCKKQPDMKQDDADLADTALSFIQAVESFINANKKQKEKSVAEKKENGVVSALLDKVHLGESMYYISIYIEDDAPMKSPVFMMVLKCVESVGSLVYSSITDEAFSDPGSCTDIKVIDIIVQTDLDKAELYTYFNFFYIEKINIVDISKKITNENDIPYILSSYAVFDTFFEGHFKFGHILLKESKKIEINKTQIKQLERWHNALNKSQEQDLINAAIIDFIAEFNLIYEFVMGYTKRNLKIDVLPENLVRIRYITLIKKAYAYVRGKQVFRLFKPVKNRFATQFKSFVELVDKRLTKVIFLDVSRISIIDKPELVQMIAAKQQLEAKGISLIVIASGPYARRIVNILDSIKTIENFRLSGTEFDALIGKSVFAD